MGENPEQYSAQYTDGQNMQAGLISRTIFLRFANNICYTRLFDIGTCIIDGVLMIDLWPGILELTSE